MAAAPYYLLALGIALVILGYLIVALSSGGPGHIDPRMSDKEIARQMNKGGNPIGGAVMFLGSLVILASIVWRLVRMFV